MNQASEKQLRKISDTADEVIRGLKGLGTEASSRDPWLIYINLDKLDSETKQLWAQAKCEDQFPTFDEFIDFLNSR
ncbi:hypothetical protein JTE90_026113 [Oedothorax gibbosus]|uniref:Uncharacterized protein n=1 Tax=Oedothorax gibbosus TaxID=931172 RepID=A0AAV6TN06_9ARAC|nr:hypothetical protein JTE90_026113 [Oedothorax gibbosus]